MKQKDIALLIVIGVVSAAISLFLSNALFGESKQREQQVETVEAISAEFPAPNNEYFNAEAVNPAQPVEIGTSSNPNPFTGQ